MTNEEKRHEEIRQAWRELGDAFCEIMEEQGRTPLW